MTDIMSKKKRSALMSRIRSKNTGIEIALLNELKERNIRGFKRYANLAGKPDFVFPEQKTVVFCDGDFWHGYNFSKWEYKLNSFWREKIAKNIMHDKLVRQTLKKQGWCVVRFWGHEIKNDSSQCIDKLNKVLMR